MKINKSIITLSTIAAFFLGKEAIAQSKTKFNPQVKEPSIEQLISDNKLPLYDVTTIPAINLSFETVEGQFNYNFKTLKEYANVGLIPIPTGVDTVYLDSKVSEGQFRGPIFHAIAYRNEAGKRSNLKGKEYIIIPDGKLEAWKIKDLGKEHQYVSFAVNPGDSINIDFSKYDKVDLKYVKIDDKDYVFAVFQGKNLEDKVLPVTASVEGTIFKFRSEDDYKDLQDIYSKLEERKKEIEEENEDLDAAIKELEKVKAPIPSKWSLAQVGDGYNGIFAGYSSRKENFGNDAEGEIQQKGPNLRAKLGLGYGPKNGILKLITSAEIDYSNLRGDVLFGDIIGRSTGNSLEGKLNVGVQYENLQLTTGAKVNINGHDFEYNGIRTDVSSFLRGLNFSGSYDLFTGNNGKLNIRIGGELDLLNGSTKTNGSNEDISQNKLRLYSEFQIAKKLQIIPYLEKVSAEVSNLINERNETSRGLEINLKPYKNLVIGAELRNTDFNSPFQKNNGTTFYLRGGFKI